MAEQRIAELETTVAALNEALRESTKLLLKCRPARGPIPHERKLLVAARQGLKVMHNEDTYQQMIDHFEEYTDVAGDHPLKLGSTTLALNAFALTGAAPSESLPQTLCARPPIPSTGLARWRIERHRLTSSRPLDARAVHYRAYSRAMYRVGSYS